MYKHFFKVQIILSAKFFVHQGISVFLRFYLNLIKIDKGGELETISFE